MKAKSFEAKHILALQLKGYQRKWQYHNHHAERQHSGSKCPFYCNGVRLGTVIETPSADDLHDLYGVRKIA
jgi:hypothetical protein